MCGRIHIQVGGWCIWRNRYTYREGQAESWAWQIAQWAWAVVEAVVSVSCCCRCPRSQRNCPPIKELLDIKDCWYSPRRCDSWKWSQSAVRTLSLYFGKILHQRYFTTKQCYSSRVRGCWAMLLWNRYQWKTRSLLWLCQRNVWWVGRPLLQTSEDLRTSTTAIRLFVVDLNAYILLATWYRWRWTSLLNQSRICSLLRVCRQSLSPFIDAKLTS